MIVGFFQRGRDVIPERGRHIGSGGDPSSPVTGAIVSLALAPGRPRALAAMRRQCQRASCAIWSRTAVMASISAGSCPGATSTP